MYSTGASEDFLQLVTPRKHPGNYIVAHPFFQLLYVFYEALTIGEPQGLPQVSFLPTSLQVKHPTICTSRLLHTTYIHTYVPIYTPIRSSVTVCTV